ncbi:hypothetical protein ABEV34_28590 [Methylorubrum rhodesianum]|uniref:hypothetical protein n=1 Tax=Methylorubrum rhodesianum TaxID=29427 RepID=UPI0016095587|nr:hypothetical protein [Methylorubrum rhodesianum]MBB5764639.1 hypothetical protein [Methylorubrum rhodesianum]
MGELGHFERRVLSYLDQRGPSHRRNVVWDLASPESKIGRARDTGTAVGGGSSSNGEAMIMGAWCRRITSLGFVRPVTDARGFYRHHEITPEGRAVLRGRQ